MDDDRRRDRESWADDWPAEAIEAVRRRLRRVVRDVLRDRTNGPRPEAETGRE